MGERFFAVLGMTVGVIGLGARDGGEILRCAWNDSGTGGLVGGLQNGEGLG